ncbi:MAG: hypothetical protein EA397_14715 [Deltaproteobacteria bacterium]|nr:MAG: hypothetical protein EA397_14715 [Deltaproteobacteria bacterium]
MRTLTLGLLSLCFSTTAIAEAPTSSLAEPEPSAGASSESSEPEGRNFDMELGFRGRTLGVPRSILDIWFWDDDAPGWIHSEPRPGVNAYSGGLEFIVKSKRDPDANSSQNGIFYVQWIANNTPEGYWDDREDPPIHTDGDYIVPSSNLGLVALGANYAYEVHLVKMAHTNGNFGLSLLFGGGLGVAFLVGELEYWNAQGGSTAIERHRAGAPSAGTKPIPPVLPLVDINAGVRFNFGDRVVLRIEGGLQTMLYAGGSLGLMF